MARTYCFNCGREVRAADTGQLPICEVCRVQQAGGLARYLVRPAGGRSQGPLTREQVVEQLRKELLAGEDRLAEEGGEWKQLDQHADFVGYFIPGDPLYDALHEERDEQVRRTSSWRRRAGAGSRSRCRTSGRATTGTISGQ